MGPLRVAAAISIVGLALATTARAAWYGSAWPYRQEITISATVTNSDLTDFPCLIRIVDAGNPVFTRAQADGDDLLFTAADGSTQLDHEIEEYDPIGGELFAWVKVPLLSSANATTLYLYYGNGTTGSQEDVPGVWSNGYEAVYHLHDDFDDSIGGHHGTNVGSTDVPAQIADGQDFLPADGNDEVRIGAWSVAGTGLTLSAWIRSDDAFAEDDPRVVSKAQGTANEDHVFMLSLFDGTSGENRLRFRLKTGTDDAIGTSVLFGSSPNGYLPDGNLWYLAAATYDGATMRLLRDGLAAGSLSKTGSMRVNSWQIAIGNNYGNVGSFGAWDGKIDEVRISSVPRSTDWLRACFRNQGDPGTYQALGSEKIEPRLIKRAFQADGTPIPSGAEVPAGATVKFLLYINNPGDAILDVSARDVLDPAAFQYLPGTIKVDSSVDVCADPDCTAAEEAAIFAAVDGAGTLTDAVDGDVASFDAATDTIDFGDQDRPNATLDLAADKVWAAVLSVKVR